MPAFESGSGAAGASAAGLAAVDPNDIDLDALDLTDLDLFCDGFPHAVFQRLRRDAQFGGTRRASTRPTARASGW